MVKVDGVIHGPVKGWCTVGLVILPSYLTPLAMVWRIVKERRRRTGGLHKGRTKDCVHRDRGDLR